MKVLLGCEKGQIVTTTPITNVVAAEPISSNCPHVFSSWKQAEAHNYFTRNQWRAQGRRIKKNAESHAAIHYKGSPRDLFCREQTSAMQPRTVAIADLINLFAPVLDIFGITPRHRDACLQIPAAALWGSPARLIARGYRVASCRNGIRVGRYLAEGFHVRAKPETNWCVIDLDNHTPTSEGTQTHLDLIKAIQDGLPDLFRWVGPGTVFFQYRSITPTGIQIFVVCKKKQAVEILHRKVRNFLLSLNHGGMDDRLKQAGLQPLNRIEILPTTTHCVSMPGIYGKTVFTDKELKVIPKKGFDAESLWTHISGLRPPGDVLGRYKELAEVGIESACPDFTATTPPVISTRATEQPPAISTGRGYWNDLKLIAINGVTCHDYIFHDYLNRLACALYFRDFASLPDKRAKTVQHLSDWIIKKHNNCISRINRGRGQEVLDQIQRTVDRLENKTSRSVKEYFSKIRAMDQRYPSRVEYIWTYMQADSPEEAILLINCKGGNSSPPVSTTPDDSPLPNALQVYLDQYFNNRHRTPTPSALKRDTFIRRFINEIGPTGSKHISKIRLNHLMNLGPDSDTTTAKRHKRILVEAKILKSGWHKHLVRGKTSSRYELQPWVISLLQGQPAETPSLPAANRRPSEGRK
jgi:hypothetical protein